MKVCTSITSGWFRQYAYEAYDRVVALDKRQSKTYVQKFKEALEKGLVKPYTKV